jgi:hypothetical protein
MCTRRLGGREWLSLFSAAYGLQQLSAVVRLHPSNLMIDLRIFFAASRVAARGGNPYDPHALVAMERRLFPTYIPFQGARALALPYMHGPLPLLVLRPFAAWDTAVIAATLTGLGGLLVVACLALAAAWPGRGWSAFAALAAGLPITVQELALGQLTLIVLAGMTGGIVLALRGRVTAGMALALVAASVKPHLGMLALCGVAAAVGWRPVRAAWTGALLGVAALLAGAWLIGGANGITGWLAAPVRFGADGSAGLQIDLLSPAALVGVLLPAPGVLDALVVAALVWAGGLAWLWRRVAGDLEAWLAVACVTWPLADPYSHTPDLVLSLPALWWLWRRAARSRRDLLLLAAAYAALWADAPLHTLAPYGTAVGRWIALPGALVLCSVVGVSLRVWERPTVPAAAGRASVCVGHGPAAESAGRGVVSVVSQDVDEVVP